MDKYSSEDYRDYGLDRVKNSPFHQHLVALRLEEKAKTAVNRAKEELDKLEELGKRDAAIKTGNSEGSVISRSE